MLRSIVLALTLLTFVGCGSSSSSGPKAQKTVINLPPPAVAVRVSMATIGNKFVFKPQQITVHPGTVVLWTNDSAADHTVTDSGGHWSSANISRGQSYNRTFTRRGKYLYVCGLHGYMTGTVVVR
jgi:plastocyanin